MSLKFCSIASGSSGNSYLVRTDGAALLIDAGVPAYRITEGLVRAQTDPDEIKAILVTHEHSDHISGLQAVARRADLAKVYASAGTWDCIQSGKPAGRGIRIEDDRRESFTPGDSFSVGDIEVRTVPVSHDTPAPVGYVLTSTAGEGSVAVITDTGVFTDDMVSAAADADVLVIEANHDIGMLTGGRYPAFLKQRILSDVGHLSNEASAEAILRIHALEKKPRCVLLAHLSAENNTPALAERTVAQRLAEEEIYSGRDLYLGVLLRSRMSVVYEI
jgi:phosphoribosyl 1,2-cyclic phosphodiesterase